MPAYKVLHLRANRLQRWNIIQAPDDLEAVRLASESETGTDLVELWQDDRRLARIKGIGTK